VVVNKFWVAILNADESFSPASSAEKDYIGNTTSQKHKIATSLAPHSQSGMQVSLWRSRSLQRELSGFEIFGPHLVSHSVLATYRAHSSPFLARRLRMIATKLDFLIEGPAFVLETIRGLPFQEQESVRLTFSSSDVRQAF
jgi:hypothetical protein